MVTALVDPVDGVSRAVEGQRWVLPLVFLSLSTSLSGAAFALRWDGSPAVVRELASTGELGRISERELAEKVQVKERVRLVTGVAKGVFLMPLGVLLVAVVLKFCGWLFGTKAPFAKCFTAASVAMLPIAVFHLVFAAAAIRQVGVTDKQMLTLVPSSLAAVMPEVPPKMSRLLSAVDFFNLWAAALLGLGFSAASGMRAHRALILGLILYLAYAGVFLVGLPALAPSGGPR